MKVVLSNTQYQTMKTFIGSNAALYVLDAEGDVKEFMLIWPNADLLFSFTHASERPTLVDYLLTWPSSREVTDLI